MKKHLMMIVAMLAIVPAAHAEQENFSVVLAKISDTHWHGDFKAVAKIGPLNAPVVSCTGPLVVKFFKGNDTDIPGEAPTVSYRHDANFNHNLNLLCETIGKNFSVVDVGNCTDFPKKWSDEEQMSVPFRTLIPRNGGNSAVVSSPSCSHGVVSRQELDLKRAELSPDGKQLLITIELVTPLLKAELTYQLNRDNETLPAQK
jgi:hypothetical protein